MAFPLHNVINGPVGVTVGLGPLTWPEQLHMAGDGGHHRPTGIGIGVLHDHAVEGASVDGWGQPLQRGPGLFPGVAHQRRIAFFGRIFPNGAQSSHAIFGCGGIDGFGHRLHILGIWLEENSFQQVHQRYIQAVQPDDWFARFIAVVVPGPVGGQNQVAGRHWDPVPVDGGVTAVAIDDEAQRGRGVPVGPGGLSWHDDLQP